jgi:hypothetical protein
MKNAIAPVTQGELISDAARRGIVSDILKIPTVQNCWPTWQPIFENHLGKSPSADDVLSLGSRLSEIFKSTRDSGGGRGQSDVSGAGTAWESLVCYYLNLCLIGTATVVFRKRSEVPRVLCDALTVSYRSVPANTESDMVAVTFPLDEPDLQRQLGNKETILDRLNAIAVNRFGDISVSVVQCKTNWNENAQIPMLWDMVYNTKSFRDPRIEVGVNSRHMHHLNWFSYAFMTVPTNALNKFTPTSLPVKRVHELSGGNYWGRNSKTGIAKSVREIFVGSRIGPGDGRDVRPFLEKALPSLRAQYDYFGI